jgi:hypothetical protein
LSVYDSQFLEAINLFPQYGYKKEVLDLIQNALKSNNIVLKIAGRCAVILLATIIENDNA